MPFPLSVPFQATIEVCRALLRVVRRKRCTFVAFSEEILSGHWPEFSAVVVATPDDCRGPDVAHVGADLIPAASAGAAAASAVSVASSRAVVVVDLDFAAAGVETMFQSR